MSGVYIKGMEMPKNCWSCPFMNGDYGFCLADGLTHGDADEKNNCPLIPVPDHGRLIDADAAIGDIRGEILEHQMNGMKGTPFYIEDLRLMWQRLDDEELIPTIIPADFAKDTNVPTKTADKEHHCKYCCHWENKENPCPWGYMYDDDDYVSDCMDFERADKGAGEC